jgi:hypothetical protein
MPVMADHQRRRFPPPWTVEEATESFCIWDAGTARAAVKLLTQRMPY